MKHFTIMCDIDGVLCTEEKTFDRSLAVQKEDAISKLNQLYEMGHTIILYTARGWAEYRMTAKQLKRWGIKFDTLICGKPIADIVIDDRAVTSLDEAVAKCQEK